MMRVKTSVYLYFLLLLLPGLALGIWLRHGMGVEVNPPLTLDFSVLAFSLPSVIFLYVALMRLPLIVWCAGYTVFSPFVGSVSMLYLGAVIGSRLGTGGLTFTEGSVSVLLLLALLLTVFIFLCGQAASHRIRLRTSAPDARTLFHSKHSRDYLGFFLATATVYLGTAILLTLL